MRGAVFRERLKRVLGARRQKPATRPDQRTDGCPVKTNQAPQHARGQRSAGITKAGRHAWPTPRLKTRASSARHTALRARCVKAANPAGCRLRRRKSALPAACLRRSCSDSRASRRTVLRSTARRRTRLGTDISKTDSPGNPNGQRCNPNSGVEATGRDLRSSLALTRLAGASGLTNTTSPGIHADRWSDTEALAAFRAPGTDHRPTTASFHAHEKSVRALAAGD